MSFVADEFGPAGNLNDILKIRDKGGLYGETWVLATVCAYFTSPPDFLTAARTASWVSLNSLSVSV